jgi:hypothetical protein
VMVDTFKPGGTLTDKEILLEECQDLLHFILMYKRMIDKYDKLLFDKLNSLTDDEMEKTLVDYVKSKKANAL